MHAVRSVVATHVLLLLLGTGCGSEDGSDDVEARLWALAEAEGFDLTEASYDGTYLRVEGDILLGPEHLEMAPEPGDLEFRGYFRGWRSVAPSHRDICIELDNTGSNRADTGWFWPMFNAAVQFNGVHNSDLDFKLVFQTQLLAHPELCEGRDVMTVRAREMDLMAEVTWPYTSGGVVHPGKMIWVDIGSTGTFKTAMHELGHNVGFSHPDPNEGFWIEGTGISGNLYPSVMWRNNDGPSGNNALKALTFDDHLSISKKY